jgi:hypothetical protein
MAESFVF